MKDFIEKLIGRLEEATKYIDLSNPINPIRCEVKSVHPQKVIDIVNQLAEECKPKTWADKIRNMSDEELAKFLMGIDRGYDADYGDFFSTSDGTFISSDVDIEEAVLEYLKSEPDEKETEIELD